MIKKLIGVAIVVVVLAIVPEAVAHFLFERAIVRAVHPDRLPRRQLVGAGPDPPPLDLAVHARPGRLPPEHRPRARLPHRHLPQDEPHDGLPAPHMTDYDLPAETEEFRGVVRSFAN